MNKRNGEFHRWIIEESTKIVFPWVIGVEGTDERFYINIRLWEDNCDKPK